MISSEGNNDKSAWKLKTQKATILRRNLQLSCVHIWSTHTCFVAAYKWIIAFYALKNNSE